MTQADFRHLFVRVLAARSLFGPRFSNIKEATKPSERSLSQQNKTEPFEST
jgi:hypothetical protein